MTTTFAALPRLSRFLLRGERAEDGHHLKLGATEHARCDRAGNIVAFPFCTSEDARVRPIQLAEEQPA